MVHQFGVHHLRAVRCSITPPHLPKPAAHFDSALKSSGRRPTGVSIQGRARSSPGGQNHGLDEASGVLPGVGGGGGVTGGDLAHCALAVVGRTVAVPTQVRLRPAAVAPRVERRPVREILTRAPRAAPAAAGRRRHVWCVCSGGGRWAGRLGGLRARTHVVRHRLTVATSSSTTSRSTLTSAKPPSPPPGRTSGGASQVIRGGTSPSSSRTDRRRRATDSVLLPAVPRAWRRGTLPRRQPQTQADCSDRTLR
ncbi:hypothetical protein RKD45_000245 [Streptomyces griseus]